MCYFLFSYQRSLYPLPFIHHVLFFSPFVSTYRLVLSCFSFIYLLISSRLVLSSAPTPIPCLCLSFLHLLSSFPFHYFLFLFPMYSAPHSCSFLLFSVFPFSHSLLSVLISFFFHLFIAPLLHIIIFRIYSYSFPS